MPVVDIKGFLDNLPHRVIMAAVCQRAVDGNILDTVKKFLKAGVMLGKTKAETQEALDEVKQTSQEADFKTKSGK